MTSPLLRIPALAAVGVLSASLLAACSESDDPEVVHVYSARQYDIEDVFNDFTEETGTEVEFLFGKDAELRERIDAEGDDTIADLYITVDAGNLAAAADAGIFTPIESDVLTENVPENLRDPENRWFGIAQRARTIIYSTERVDPSELSTYEALTDPEWAGRLCLRTANSTYTQSLVASMIAGRGEDETRAILEGWLENAEIYSNDVEIIENIAAGACDVAITNHYYLARELVDNPDLPVGLVWADQGPGEDGVHVNVSGAGVTAAGNNPEGAQALLEYLVDEGQATLVGDNQEFPVNPDTEIEPLLVEFGEYTAQDINAQTYAERNADAIDLLGSVGYE